MPATIWCQNSTKRFNWLFLQLLTWQRVDHLNHPCDQYTGGGLMHNNRHGEMVCPPERGSSGGRPQILWHALLVEFHELLV